MANVQVTANIKQLIGSYSDQKLEERIDANTFGKAKDSIVDVSEIFNTVVCLVEQNRRMKETIMEMALLLNSEDLKSRISELDRDQHSFRVELDELKNQVRDVESDIKIDLNSLSDNVNDANNNVENLEDKINDLSSKLDEVSQDLYLLK